MSQFHNRFGRHSGSVGFTLIELMIAVTIIGVLAAIAVPSYSSYMARARRADAQTLLMDVYNKQKQYLLDARAYTNIVGPAGLALSKDGWDCTTVATKCSNVNYELTISALDNAAAPPTYEATAVARGSQLNDGNLKITSQGVKTRVGFGSW